MNRLKCLTLGVAMLMVSAPPPADSARILGLFPHHGESHFYFFDPILRALDAAGHDVHIVSHFEMKNMSSRYQEIVVKKPGSTHNSVNLGMFPTKRPSFMHFLEFFMLRGWGTENCEITLATPAVQEMIKTRPKYDLILMEQFNSDCLYGLAHHLDAPVIALASTAMMPWHYDRMGNPPTPSLTPSLFMGYSDRMSFRQRLSNWLCFYGMKALYTIFSHTDSNALIRKYIGEDIPDVRDLVKQTSMYFINQHYSLGGAKPIVPSVVELGGIHIKKQKPLEMDLEELISSAEHGVIYVSWGSMIKASTMPPEKFAAIVKAMGQFKQRIIWKWEGEEEIPNKPANIFTSKWLPQKDILCHPNVKVFWTHGGYGGSAETTHCGVPVVATPMYGDQHLNAAAFEARGAGILLPYEDISVETVVEALKFALLPSTAENAKKLAFAFNNRPLKPIQTAVYWVEHTIATGGQPLMKPSSTYLPWYVCYGVDVVLFVLAAVLVLGYSWVWILKKLCKKKVPSGGKKVKKN